MPIGGTCPSVFPLQILAWGRGAYTHGRCGLSSWDTYVPYLRAAQVEGGSAESEVLSSDAYIDRWEKRASWRQGECWLRGTVLSFRWLGDPESLKDLSHYLLLQIPLPPPWESVGTPWVFITAFLIKALKYASIFLLMSSQGSKES